MSKTSITWEDQWERVKRLAGWIDELYSADNQLDQSRAKDVVYSFLLNAYSPGESKETS